MNNEEKFKKSLSNLIQSKEFPFDETNWERASEMIDASRQAGRKAPFIYLSVLLLILSGIGGFYFLMENNSTIAEKIAVASPAQQIKASEENSIPSKVITSARVNKVRTSASEPAAIDQTPSQKQITPVDQPTSESVAPKTLAPEIEKIPAIPNANTTPEKSAPSEIKPVTNEPVKQTGTIKNPLIASDVENGTPASPVKEEKTKETTKNEESHEITNAIAPVQPATTNPVANTKETKDQSLTETVLIDSVYTLTPQKINSLPVMKGVGIDPIVPKIDSAMLLNDISLVYQPKEKPVWISIEGGVSYLYGWKNPGSTDAKGYNPLIGINYFQNVTDKLSVSLGIQYTSIGNLNYSNHTTKVTTLNMGEENKVTVFTPVKVHYLVAPLRAHYNLNYKNTIGIGCNVAYLLTVDSEIETYDQTLTSSSGYNLSKDKGYTEGFTQFDAQLSVFYRRKLHPNLSFNAELFYGLTDTKDNNFFHSNVFERNNGLKLSLVYNILKK
jgi:hypothetical protein